MDVANTPQGRLALEFVRALAAGEVDRAHQMLSSGLRAALSPADLERQYEAVVGEGPAAVVGATSLMDDWPGKVAADLGWVYAAIDCDVYSEAITVVITREDGETRIRQIEWGRP
jgi:hypothetical protein